MTPPTDEQMGAMEEYLGRVKALVIEQDWLTPEEFHDVWHLIEHDEPAEGLCTLAWIISDNQQHVPAQVIANIHRCTEGLVDPADLPPDLDRFAI